ncbi:hypothetical protein FB446DRAFT_789369 [Lentinula raphanica]|nr:hypothetical protein FB446DRAFT_789369 [Lentinula raphanica]
MEPPTDLELLAATTRRLTTRTNWIFFHSEAQKCLVPCCRYLEAQNLAKDRVSRPQQGLVGSARIAFLCTTRLRKALCSELKHLVQRPTSKLTSIWSSAPHEQKKSNATSAALFSIVRSSTTPPLHYSFQFPESMTPGRRLSLSELLNPTTGPPSPSLPPLAAPSTSSFNVHVQRLLRHVDFKLNRKTTLSAVYEYPVGEVVEYPETGTDNVGAIGHLFKMEGGGNWASPARNFAYSRGPPRGKERFPVEVPLLVSSATGKPVLCISRHSTCQGVKVCPFLNLEDDNLSHSCATRDKLQARLTHAKFIQDESATPGRAVFEKTAAYITALKRFGCPAESFDVEYEENTDCFQTSAEERHTLHRGYPERLSSRCSGQLVFGLTLEGCAYIKCEFYSHKDRSHLYDGTVGSGCYDVEYLEAVLTGDVEEISRIEAEAEVKGYGPNTGCDTVINCSSQRLTCAWSHRFQDDTGNIVLTQPSLTKLNCACTFREYEPLEEYREVCPYVLVVSKGVHSHPIPFPEKTPISVKVELDALLRRLDVDLADISSRHFLRHPIVKSYLAMRFPLIQNPMLSDLHVSLSNWSHLKVYIDAVKRECFPAGTGWKGLLYLKEQQDLNLSPDEHYVRSLLKAGSQRFSQAQYLQSDIGFKRVIGFYEFEIASVDENTNTSVTLCRVYLTRQTAFAHLQALKEINRIITSDVGYGLQWRHIHGSAVDDYDGHILNWVVDQHRGQAKGLGLFVQQLAQAVPRKQDFHQLLRSVQELSPYEHLRRFLTLCTTHFSRNIRKCAVPPEVRNLMRSLDCIRHDNWDETLSDIRRLGGRAGENWVSDKEQSKFAFPAICWEKSYIPLEIWQARRRESNVVEIVHANVNLEGTQCTLVGGVMKGKHFDVLKQRALQSRELLGIRESYSSKHRFENEIKNLKRRVHSRQRNFYEEDKKIEAHNVRISELHTKWHEAKRRLLLLSGEGEGSSERTRTLQNAQAAEDKIRERFAKQVKVGEGLAGKGSGKIGVLLPARESRVA